MKIDIHSREAIKKLIGRAKLENSAVISFYSPNKSEKPKVEDGDACRRVFYICIPDIDIEILGSYGYSYDSFLSEADELAGFIYEAVKDGCSIICQCDYGQSRSAACAAAILQHFEKRGIDIFADYRYYPNQLVYNKIFDALEKYAKNLALNDEDKK
jgi:hypothetical protein